MKKILVILILLGGMLQLPAKAMLTSNDPEGTAAGKTVGLSNDFKIFPNPVTGGKITVESIRQPLTEIRISNIAGKPVYQKKLNPAISRVEVMTHDLPVGIYVLNIKAADHSAKTVKLLISR
ncbi:MAG TPA: T9SS type A sorting domain-containing protein [Prolixibacteraceae bacterium]|nr:T9SS type A sorting domain-containing protein [Prolixibacteraceae bacterium]